MCFFILRCSFLSFFFFFFFLRDSEDEDEEESEQDEDEDMAYATCEKIQPRRWQGRSRR